jgi:hypothetical protein
MHRFLYLIVLFFSFSSYSQKTTKDSTQSSFKKDTLVKAKFKQSKKNLTELAPLVFGLKKYNNKQLPKVAFTRSLLVPGWGQITNKQYYKLPFIYGGAGAATYFIIRNDKKCEEYVSYLRNMGDQNEILIDGRGPYSKDLINNAAKQYRRWKQGTVIGFAVGWLLFAVDANVTAHLKTFDSTNDISLKLNPKIINFAGQNAAGLGINLNF